VFILKLASPIAFAGQGGITEISIEAINDKQKEILTNRNNITIQGINAKTTEVKTTSLQEALEFYRNKLNSDHEIGNIICDGRDLKTVVEERNRLRVRLQETYDNPGRVNEEMTRIRTLNYKGIATYRVEIRTELERYENFCNLVGEANANNFYFIPGNVKKLFDNHQENNKIGYIFIPETRRIRESYIVFDPNLARMLAFGENSQWVNVDGFVNKINEQET